MLHRVLHVTSSLFGPQGASSQLSGQLIEALRRHRPELTVESRHLSADSIPHLDAETVGAFGIAPEQRDPRQQERVRRSDTLIDELRRAELLVLGLPMYNFGVPSTVRAWFDHLARAGVSFRYTENGPEGLIRNTRALVIATRGGVYEGPSDHQTPYVEQFLRFIGIEEIEWIHVQGLALGPSEAEQSLAQARERIEGLASELAGASS